MKNEAPSSSRSRFLFPALLREQNPSEAERCSHSSSILRSRFSAKGDKQIKRSSRIPRYSGSLKKAFGIVLMAFFVMSTGYSFVSAQTSTDSANEIDPIREKVQEKINEIRSNPKAYLGSITDIADSTIQTTNDEGAIEQISVEENTAFVQLDDSEEIEYEDLAIGDYIIALGYKDETEVLESTRVLVTTQPEPLTRLSERGIVANIESGDFTLEAPYDETFEIVTTRFTDVFIVADDEIIEGDTLDIEDGDEVIVVGEIVDDEFEAYHIQIIKKAEIDVDSIEVNEE